MIHNEWLLVFIGILILDIAKDGVYKLARILWKHALLPIWRILAPTGGWLWAVQQAIAKQSKSA